MTTLVEALQQLEPHLKSIEYDAKSQGYWVSNRNHFFSDELKGDWRSEFVCSEIKDAIAERGWSLILQQCGGKWSAMILGDALDAEMEEIEFDTEWEALTHEFVSVVTAEPLQPDVQDTADTVDPTSPTSVLRQWFADKFSDLANEYLYQRGFEYGASENGDGIIFACRYNGIPFWSQVGNVFTITTDSIEAQIRLWGDDRKERGMAIATHSDALAQQHGVTPFIQWTGDELDDEKIRCNAELLFGEFLKLRDDNRNLFINAFKEHEEPLRSPATMSQQEKDEMAANQRKAVYRAEMEQMLSEEDQDA